MAWRPSVPPFPSSSSSSSVSKPLFRAEARFLLLLLLLFPPPSSFQSIDAVSGGQRERESEVRIRINCGILLYARKEVSSSSVSGFEYRGFEEKEKGRGKKKVLTLTGHLSPKW